MKWRLLRAGVYTAGRFSIERTPRGLWTLYLHAGDAAAACSRGDGPAPDRLGTFDRLDAARAAARKEATILLTLLTTYDS